MGHCNYNIQRGGWLGFILLVMLFVSLLPLELKCSHCHTIGIYIFGLYNVYTETKKYHNYVVAALRGKGHK